MRVWPACALWSRTASRLCWWGTCVPCILWFFAGSSAARWGRWASWSLTVPVQKENSYISTESGFSTQTSCCVKWSLGFIPGRCIFSGYSKYWHCFWKTLGLVDGPWKDTCKIIYALGQEYRMITFILIHTNFLNILFSVGYIFSYRKFQVSKMTFSHSWYWFQQLL